MTPIKRLKKIAELIEAVDNRAIAADGPVPPTRQEITDAEMRTIYRLAKMKSPKTRDTREGQKPNKPAHLRRPKSVQVPRYLPGLKPNQCEW